MRSQKSGGRRLTAETLAKGEKSVLTTLTGLPLLSYGLMGMEGLPTEMYCNYLSLTHLLARL